MSTYQNYLHDCQQARSLGEMRTQAEEKRCKDEGITPGMKAEANLEVELLSIGFADQPPAEQLRRYERLFELFKIRGFFYTPDPMFDLIRIGVARQHMRELKNTIAGAASVG